MALNSTKPSSVGKMREVVVFLVNNPTVNPSGGQVDSYTTLLTTRGMLVDNSGARILTFNAIEDVKAVYMICRFQTAITNTLRTDTKVVMNSVTYTMQGRPKLINQLKHLYQFELKCQQP